MSQYQVYVTPDVVREIKDLPGHMRLRVKRAIEALAADSHPSESKVLELPLEADVTLRRLRLDKWRVVYLVADAEHTIDVVAVRKRPPYDYGDLRELLTDLV